MAGSPPMGRIRQLDSELAALVAAGEVIESPAAVVRELVDNALDAGATQVVVEIERGGSGRIVVRDDGVGMDREDVVLAFERHATSKLARAEELLRVRSLGFRGEALPSIAAVARVSLRSAQAAAAEGWLTRWSGGRHERLEAVAARPGTVVEVEELFFNLPARRKFLGAVASQAREVDRALRLQALAFPEVGFCLRRDGVESWRRPAGEDIDRRAALVLGGEAEGLWPLRESLDGIGELAGWISAPGVCRRGRRLQVWVLGRRAIRSEALGAALRRAYGNGCAPGENPLAVLRLELEDSHDIDWNVHPAKQEVRFSERARVERGVEAMVAAALREGSGAGRGGARGTSPPPDPGFRPGDTGIENREEEKNLSMRVAEAGPGYAARDGETAAARGRSVALRWQPRARQLELEGTVAAPGGGATPGLPAPAAAAVRWLGLLPPDYALLEQQGGLLIADLQAVLERVGAERMAGGCGAEASQILLLPLTATLPAAVAEAVLADLPAWQALGWDMDDFGGGTLLVRAAPAAWPTLESAQLPALFEQLHGPLDGLRARHARAWARQLLAQVEPTAELGQGWLAELWECAQPYLAPSGRPTVWWISERELARRFGR